MDQVLHSSNSNEHYTPAQIINNAIEFYNGVIDLDPCSNSLVRPNVRAEFHYTKELDGLRLPWAGKVFDFYKGKMGTGRISQSKNQHGKV